MESFEVESISSQRKKKLETNSSRVSPFPNGVSQWGATNYSKSVLPAFGPSFKLFSASLPGSRIASRATSPASRRSSPPRTATPCPKLAGFISSNHASNDAELANDNMGQEVLRLRDQVEDLARKSQVQEAELERTTKQLKEAKALAGEETAKCKAAKEVIKSLTAQLKEMAERLPPGVAWNSCLPMPAFPGCNNAGNVSKTPSETLRSLLAANETGFDGSSNHQDVSDRSILAVDLAQNSGVANILASGDPGNGQATPLSRKKIRTSDLLPNHGSEWVEQDEPGVYITLVSLPNGTRDLKRVRFSRKRFSEKEAEHWWATNRARIYQQYNVPAADKSSFAAAKKGAAH